MIVQAKNAGKWVNQVRPEDSVGSTACLTLKPRLKAVRQSLKLAAKHWHDDVEHVHQLRVHSRRCLAAIELYKDVLPKRQWKRLQHCLVEIRRAAGEARDMDVLLAKYRQTNHDVWPVETAGDGSRAMDAPDTIARCRKRICRQIRKLRRRAQKPIRQLYKRLIVSGRLQKWSKQLLKSIPTQSSVDQPTFGPWAQNHFCKAVERFASVTPKAGAALKEWHRFRIRGKQLRYTMELVVAVYDREFRTELYALVSQLQDNLGKLIDHSAACHYLSTFQRQIKKGPESQLLEMMIARENEQLVVTLVEFQSWWLAEAQAELAQLVERYSECIFKMDESSIGTQCQPGKADVP